MNGNEEMLKVHIYKQKNILTTHDTRELETLSKECSDIISPAGTITRISLEKNKQSIVNQSIEEKIQIKVESPKTKRKKTNKTLSDEIKETYRRDAYGNAIRKNNGKKYKVTFIDEVKKANLKDIVNVESYKKYNVNEEDNGKIRRIQCCAKICLII